MICDRLLKKLVELTGSRVALDLSVPKVSVALEKPLAKLRENLGREFLDRSKRLRLE